MFGEKRRHQRYIINRNAKIQTDSGALARDCIITDISEDGARLFCSGDEVPERFYLLISGAEMAREECHVVWRLGGEVGIKFIANKPAKERIDAMNRLRTEARQIFGTAP